MTIISTNPDDFVESSLLLVRDASVQSRHGFLSTAHPALAALENPAAACTADDLANPPKTTRALPKSHCRARRGANGQPYQLQPVLPVLLRKERNLQSRFRRLPIRRPLAHRRLRSAHRLK